MADLDFVWEKLQVELPARFVVFPDAPVPPRNVRRPDGWEQLCHHAAEVQQQGAPVVVAEHLAQVHELAQALASNADFQRIPTLKKRTEAAPRLLPDLLRIMRARPGGYRLAEDVAREAWRIYQEELVPAEEEEMARQAEGLITQGLGKQATAGRLGISPDRLNRIMARYSQKGM